GVAAVGAGHGRHTEPFAPHFELRGCGGTERVTGGEHHAFAVPLVVLGELRDGGGFPGAVHADDHHDAPLDVHHGAADVQVEADAPERLAPAVRLQLVQ